MISAAQRSARGERFALESAELRHKAPPKKVFAHPESLEVTVRGGADPARQLVTLCRRRLAAGSTLSAAQRAALSSFGVDADTLTPLFSEPSVPAIYVESGVVLPPASRTRSRTLSGGADGDFLLPPLPKPVSAVLSPTEGGAVSGESVEIARARKKRREKEGAGAESSTASTKKKRRAEAARTLSH